MKDQRTQETQVWGLQQTNSPRAISLATCASPLIQPCPLTTDLGRPATRSPLSCLHFEHTAQRTGCHHWKRSHFLLLGLWVTPWPFHFRWMTKKFLDIPYIIRSSLEILFFYLQLDLGYQKWSRPNLPFHRSKEKYYHTLQDREHRFRIRKLFTGTGRKGIRLWSTWFMWSQPQLQLEIK